MELTKSLMLLGVSIMGFGILLIITGSLMLTGFIGIIATYLILFYQLFIILFFYIGIKIIKGAI